MLLMTMHTSLSDQALTKLLCVVHEQVGAVQGNIMPHLWTYRSRITLEHLSLTIQQENLKDDYPMLFEFLQQVP